MSAALSEKNAGEATPLLGSSSSSSKLSLSRVHYNVAPLLQLHRGADNGRPPEEEDEEEESSAAAASSSLSSTLSLGRGCAAPGAESAESAGSSASSALRVARVSDLPILARQRALAAKAAKTAENAPIDESVIKLSFPVTFRDPGLESRFRRQCRQTALRRWNLLMVMHALWASVALAVGQAHESLMGLPIFAVGLISAYRQFRLRGPDREEEKKLAEQQSAEQKADNNSSALVLRQLLCAPLAVFHFEVWEGLAPLLTLLYTEAYCSRDLLRVGRCYVAAMLALAAAGVDGSRLRATLPSWLLMVLISVFSTISGSGDGLMTLAVCCCLMAKQSLELHSRLDRMPLKPSKPPPPSRPAASSASPPPATKADAAMKLLAEVRNGVLARTSPPRVCRAIDELAELLSDGRPLYTINEQRTFEQIELAYRAACGASRPPGRLWSSVDVVDNQLLSSLSAAFGGLLRSAAVDGQRRQPMTNVEREQRQQQAEEELQKPRRASDMDAQHSKSADALELKLRLGLEWSDEPVLQEFLPMALENRQFLRSLGCDMRLDLLDIYRSPASRYPLSIFGPFMLSEFLPSAGISPVTLRKFLLRVDQAYLHQNPYHNAVHGLAVGHQALVLLRDLGLTAAGLVSWGALEVCAFLLACFGHDAGHPARTAAFVSNFVDPLALMFPESPLEYLHSFLLLAGLANSQTDVFAHVHELDKPILRKRMTETILSTDMSNNAAFVARFKLALPHLDPQYSTNDAWLLSSIVIKLADIGHAILPRVQHIEWSNRVVEEMYRQTEEEEHWRGVSSMPFFRRQIHSTNFPRTQQGFLRMLAAPVARTLLEAFPDNRRFQRYLQQFNAHLDWWADETGRLAAGQPCQGDYILPTYYYEDEDEAAGGSRAPPSNRPSQWMRNKCSEPLLRELAVISGHQHLAGQNALVFPFEYLKVIFEDACSRRGAGAEQQPTVSSSSSSTESPQQQQLRSLFRLRNYPRRNQIILPRSAQDLSIQQQQQQQQQLTFHRTASDDAGAAPAAKLRLPAKDGGTLRGARRKRRHGGARVSSSSVAYLPLREHDVWSEPPLEGLQSEGTSLIGDEEEEEEEGEEEEGALSSSGGKAEASTSAGPGSTKPISDPALPKGLDDEMVSCPSFESLGRGESRAASE